MAELNKEAASLIHSAAALKERAQKAGLSDAETQAILDNGVTSIAQMAFAITPPGTAFFAGRAGVNLGTVTSTKLLVFQCHTLVVANIKPEVGRKDDLSTHATLPAAERDRRIADQQKRLQGLRFRGDEEVAHSCYDQVFTILERDTLTYLHPEKFITRRTELLQKKPLKQLSLDNDSLTVKEKPSDHVCSTRTELELVQALRRRALGFDLIGLISYETMNNYHADLLSHLQEDAPPGYCNTTVTQVLRADRAAFLHLAETLTSLKRTTTGELPLEVELPKVLTRPNVSFDLLPLANNPPKSTAPAKPGAPANNANKRKHEDAPVSLANPGRQSKKGKGKGKGKSKRKGRGPNVPRELVGKALETIDGRRIFWPYNLKGCTDAPPGGQCSRGVHVCAEPGCGKPHSLSNHS